MTVRKLHNIVLHVGLKCTFKLTFSLLSIVKEYVDTKLNFCFDKKYAELYCQESAYHQKTTK